MQNTQKATIYSFDPTAIETMLGKQDWNAAWQYLTGVLESLTMTAGIQSQKMGLMLEKDMSDASQREYIRNFGGLLSELFVFLLTTETVFLNDKNFEKLIMFHETLHTFFSMYSFGDTDELVKSLWNPDKKISAVQQKKMLLLLSMNTTLDIVKILESVEPSYRLAALIGFSSYRKIFRENVYNNKVALYKLRSEFEKAYKDEGQFFNLLSPYFLSSYLNIPDKHELKKNINTACRSYLSESKSYRKSKAQPLHQSLYVRNKDRPTILVIAELFSKGHAMYRCWGERTIGLQSEFNVFFAIPADAGDPQLKDDFPNYYPMSTLEEFYDIVHNVKPDILFMPSVGMRLYSILPSNMRAAPIQIMGLGHPATSNSDLIDYVVGPESIYDEQAFPNDIYINDLYPGNYVPLLSKEKFLQPIAPKPVAEIEDRYIRIGIVGTDIKVSYPFFSFLEKLIKDAPFKIHVSFLMGVGGIDSLDLEKYLGEKFDNFTYYGWQSYPKYIETIRSLDIVVNPFPFGHTNTIIDALMSGKPCIGLEGIEPASKSEGDVLQSVGLKDQFVATSEDDYRQKFYAIGEKILSNAGPFFDREDIYNRLFTTPEHYDYGKIFKWIYDNNERLKSSGRKYFSALEDI